MARKKCLGKIEETFCSRSDTPKKETAPGTGGGGIELRERKCQIPLASLPRISPHSRPRGRLAQLVRALASHARGHKFESCTAHHGLLLPQPS